jgi:hypothetical protein
MSKLAMAELNQGIYEFCVESNESRELEVSVPQRYQPRAEAGVNAR